MGAVDDVKGAVKVTRADAVKLVMQEMVVQTAGAVAECEREVELAKERFRKWAVDEARDYWERVLWDVATAVGTHHDQLTARCTYRLYEDGTDSGEQVQVVFMNAQAAYDSRLKIALNIDLDDEGRGLRSMWLGALAVLDVARKRDTRTGAMTKEARDALIKAALDSSDEGQAVVAAVRALSAMLRGKV